MEDETMNELDNFETKVLAFAVGLQNAYKDEDNRESVSKLELTEDGLTEDFTAMLEAMRFTYQRITDDDVDLIGFTHILNRLAMQHLMVPKKEVEVNE
jgi:hypothetical protein